MTDSEPRAIHFLDQPVEVGFNSPPARNMRPSHALAAAERGSLNVGRFFFRVRVDTGQVFDLYYDRPMKNVDDRKGQWFVYRELKPD